MFFYSQFGISDVRSNEDDRRRLCPSERSRSSRATSQPPATAQGTAKGFARELARRVPFDPDLRRGSAGDRSRAGKAARAIGRWLSGAPADCPTGKSKIFRFFRIEISFISPTIPHPREGRTRRHERWAREAMDAFASRDEDRSGRQSRVAPIPRRWDQAGGLAMSALWARHAVIRRRR